MSQSESRPNNGLTRLPGSTDLMDRLLHVRKRKRAFCRRAVDRRTQTVQEQVKERRRQQRGQRSLP
jgi:hypothetical protein